MREIPRNLLWIVSVGAAAAALAAEPQEIEKTYVVSPQTLQAIEKAAPAAPRVAPQQPRKLLVYGRVPTHPESVACCFKAMEILGRKTGAFEAVCSGDPLVFLPERLQEFDAVVMNNTHERTPWLPRNLDQLGPEEQAQARDREPLLQQSLLKFVASGKGIVGIHGATAGNVQWPEFVELFGAQYSGHFAGEAWVEPVGPAHPLTDFLGSQSFPVRDEIYMFRKALGKEPFTADGVRVVLRLDLNKTPDPGKRADKNYVVSWIRTSGKGRVFYCSLGHQSNVYTNPLVLQHYLAGIQWAMGDLPADATPLP